MLRESKSVERQTDTLVVLVFLWDLLFGFVKEKENRKRPALSFKIRALTNFFLLGNNRNQHWQISCPLGLYMGQKLNSV